MTIRRKGTHFTAKRAKKLRFKRPLAAEPELKYLQVLKPLHLIPEMKGALNYQDLNEIIGDVGLKLKSIEPLIRWLDLSEAGVAKLISVSPRTVSRWTSSSTIGVLPSKTFVRIDEVLARGREIFDNDESFKQWLEQPNTALNNTPPLELLNKPFGTEMVEDALEALAYGNLL